MRPLPEIGLPSLAIQNTEEGGQRVVDSNFILRQGANGVGIGHSPAHRGMGFGLPHREEVVGSSAQGLRGSDEVRLQQTLARRR